MYGSMPSPQILAQNARKELSPEHLPHNRARSTIAHAVAHALLQAWYVVDSRGRAHGASRASSSAPRRRSALEIVLHTSKMDLRADDRRNDDDGD